METFANAAILEVPCPLCDAAVGEPCLSRSGKSVQGWRLWSNDGTRSVRYLGVHSLREAKRGLSVDERRLASASVR